VVLRITAQLLPTPPTYHFAQPTLESLWTLLHYIWSKYAASAGDVSNPPAETCGLPLPRYSDQDLIETSLFCGLDSVPNCTHCCSAPVPLWTLEMHSVGRLEVFLRMHSFEYPTTNLGLLVAFTWLRYCLWTGTADFRGEAESRIREASCTISQSAGAIIAGLKPRFSWAGRRCMGGDLRWR